MGTIATPSIFVPAPPRRPRKGGIASAASFETNSRIGTAGVLQYDAEACGLALGSIQLCYGAAVNLGTNEVQTVTITGAPTGGSFRLTWDGQQTVVIAYNATAATVRAALEALPNIGVGNVTVSGGPGPATPYVVTFVEQLAAENVAQMTATHTFTGGTTPAIAVTTTTPGAPPTDLVGGGLTAGAGIVPNFGAYVGVQCFIGDTMDEFGPRARTQMEASQDRAVEAVLWGWLNAAPNTAVTAASGGLDEAIAQAEQFADANYIGEPVLHVSRHDAVRAGVLSPNPVSDGKIWTPNGTPVVASSKYTSGTVVVSGGIGVTQSEVIVREGLDITHNTMLAIAERVFGIAVDCDFRQKFTVT